MGVRMASRAVGPGGSHIFRGVVTGGAVKLIVLAAQGILTKIMEATFSDRESFEDVAPLTIRAKGSLVNISMTVGTFERIELVLVIGVTLIAG